MYPALGSSDAMRRATLLVILIGVLIGALIGAACSADARVDVRRFQLTGVVVGHEESSPRSWSLTKRSGAHAGDEHGVRRPWRRRVGGRRRPNPATLVLTDAGAGSRTSGSPRGTARPCQPRDCPRDAGSCLAGPAADRSGRRAVDAPRPRRPRPDRHLHLYPVPAAGFLSADDQGPRARARRANEDGLGSRLALLGVTLDPAFDTPPVLRVYGESMLKGSDRFEQWTLATGTPAQIEDVARFFGVGYRADGGFVTHALTTAVVSHDGRGGRRPSDACIRVQLVASRRCL